MPVEKIVVGRDRDDLKEFGLRGTAFIGKHVVGEGEESHLTNAVQMDVTRPHIVLVCGKRGTGKCLDGDTIITLEDGSQVPIKSLENDRRRVHSLDKKLKISLFKKTGFYKRKADTLLHIKTRSGKEIKLTPEHPLLTIKGWREANDIGIGGRIATPRRVSFGKDEMEDCKIKLLAYLLAEGHTRKHKRGKIARFSNTDAEIINDFKKSLTEFDSNLKLTKYKEGSFGISKKVRTVDASQIKRDKKGQFKKGSVAKPITNSLISWLENIGAYGELSVNKSIPHAIFLQNKEKTALFLNRLFSCDGSLYMSRGKQWEISYSSSSKTLIHQVHHLLLRFGILSRIRKKNIKLDKKNFESFEIVIGGDNVTSFITSIGFFGQKHLRQKEYLARPEINRNPNVDTVPKEIWDVYRPKSWSEIGRQLGYSIPKGLRTSIHYGPSRQKLMQISKLDNNDIIFTLASSDIFWDEIVFLEKLEGTFDVYDIGVPEMHNFVANNIIVHNSYDGGVIAEEISLLPPQIRKNLSVLMFDTMGIYWSMKHPNTKDSQLLKQWGMKPQKIPIKLFVPKGYVSSYENVGVEVDAPLTLPTGEMTAMDWILTFGFSPIDEYGIVIERIIKSVKEKYGSVYSINDIIFALQSDKKTEIKIKDALANRFLAAIEWGVFEKKGTPVKDLFNPGGVSVIDVSHYMSVSSGWSVKGMLVGLLSRKIFQERLMARKAEEFEVMTGEQKKTIPMIWIMIDEAHMFLPSTGETTASQPLHTLIKQGREPGISLLMITQRPNRLHEDALAQADIVISHRLTSKADLEALRGVMQTYMMDDIKEYINSLPRKKGAAIVLDDNSERIYSIQVRPRFSWHAGGSPSALKKKGLFD